VFELAQQNATLFTSIRVLFFISSTTVKRVIFCPSLIQIELLQMYNASSYWIAMPTVMPKHKTICIQTFLNLLTLKKTKYGNTTTHEIEDVKKWTGIWAHDYNFDKFH
jgi:hypothetical protein